MNDWKICDIGGCRDTAVIELSSRRIDGPMGWRRAMACKAHARRVGEWVSQDFDDSSNDLGQVDA